MIKYIYAYKKKSAGFFLDPIFSPLDEEHFKDTFIQGSFNIPSEQVGSYKDLDLYCLGTYDNVKSHFEIKSDFLLDCCQVIETTEAIILKANKQKEVKDNGQGV